MKIIPIKTSAKDTEENQKVHDAFRSFSKAECDDNYTQALRKLLEFYQGDYKFEAIWDKLVALEQEVTTLKKPEELEKKDEGDFETF